MKFVEYKLSGAAKTCLRDLCLGHEAVPACQRMFCLLLLLLLVVAVLYADPHTRTVDAMFDRRLGFAANDRPLTRAGTNGSAIIRRPGALRMVVYCLMMPGCV